MKKLLLTASLLITFLSLNAKVNLPSLIGDNMVLQQQTNANIWGKAQPGQNITVTPSWSDKSYTTTTDDTGRWILEIETPEASYNPYTITISDGEDTVLNNILVGEVWLASGQSNMQMPLKGFDGCPVKDGFEEIATARNRADKIRFITIPTVQNYTPQEDVEAAWVVPSPQTAPDFSATAWYYACRLNDVLDVPVGIVSAPYGGARVESWTPREILETYPDVSLDPKDIESMTHYLRPLLMYNAMFVPVKNYTYKGIIWYQGCSNTSTYETYAERLATMVQHWRKEIGDGDIPFYEVEIAPFQYDNPKEVSKAAKLREAQWKSTELIPNSGIISTNDLIEPFERHNIHPSRKAPVGRRLGDLALNRTYGQKQMRADYMRYKDHNVKGNEVWINFEIPEGGICRNYDIQGFEIAGPDKVFYPADSVWHHWETGEIVVSSEKVQNPVAVRYCFKDFMPGTMYGGNFLPLVPFRSDDWD